MTKLEVYQTICIYCKLSFDQIADMTYKQQFALLKEPDKLFFSTFEEYQTWHQQS